MPKYTIQVVVNSYEADTPQDAEDEILALIPRELDAYVLKVEIDDSDDAS